MEVLRWEGGRELLAALEQLPQRIGSRFVREALTHAAEPMARRMAQLAPRGAPTPPNLRDEILIRNAKGEDSRDIAVAVGPSNRGFYGSFQEFGTANHSAQPFVRPAFDELTGETLKRFADDVWVSLASRKIGRASATTDVPIDAGPGGVGL